MIKFVYLVKRAEHLTFEEFVKYHRESHAPLFKSIPEAAKYVRRYTVSHPVPAEQYPAPGWDSVVEIWFDSWADHDAFFTSENYRTLVQPDESTFFVHADISVMVTEERVII
ncbi:ethyl tert-butyl ether degradation protein EthD [Kribbella sp. ALI-6-A]|uniref:EthD domain-containing protein n=1 Tax=Kribbella sp. ALI-6-A TaxID=1933817 RepID=UPI00097C8383|nr:EthD domain-containing protein [Kribbella sp. ALI-6-A]ONI78317.1 ethyl tert-butyl ether degradation protein EthD [Kribbella sp. ALI-6-A]